MDPNVLLFQHILMFLIIVCRALRCFNEAIKENKAKKQTQNKNGGKLK